MTNAEFMTDLLNTMSWRCIGPPRGGRVVAVAGDPRDPAVYYFGAVAGGIWKTEDAGTTWVNVSDGFLKTSSVGALTVSESDPNVIYTGMGETTIRTDVSHGDGVYKSTDGGHTWRHMGLADTRHIGEIRVHPRKHDLVYAAALGHAFGPNQERGVYRSTDGGHSWEQVLFKSEKAGAADLALDPLNPRILYASIWETHRNFWELSSGGPDSGIWKSDDGGDTWTEITANKGLPAGVIGKIGLSASPVQAGRVWALIESSEAPGLYRSDDFGATWKLTSSKQDLRYRPWYYMHVFADTQDADTVYVNNLSLWKSSDGGANFEEITTPHGDNHDLWIDPNNSQRMIQSNDGGANVSLNGGRSWSSIYNQLTAQFYIVTVDNQFPYRVYGTQQDNSSISVPSDTISGAITWADCYPAGTGESGYIAVHPQNPDIVYVGAVGSSPGGAGALQRYDHASGHIQLINVWPQAHGGLGADALKYRFPWTFPILFSPHNPDILYTAGNVVFKSEDEGHSWTPISPDLTRADMEKLGASGGPITKDTSGAEHYATIYTLCESPHEAGVFWAGSDDGLVHLSRDGGASWQNVTPPDLPEWSFIRTVEPSPFEPGSAYLAATRYKLDDPAPYLFKTDDYGASWQAIVDGIPVDDYTRVIRADPEAAGILYAGTETGLYVSLNDGESWQRWAGNLPVTPIYDLVVKENDLVAATHGRSFWIMDDLTPLHQAAGAGAHHLFRPRTTYRILPNLVGEWVTSEGKGYDMGLGSAATFLAEKSESGQVERTFLDAGAGAPRGAIFNYHLTAPAAAGAAASLTILDAEDNLVRRFEPKPADYDQWDDKRKSLDSGPWLPLKGGMNRFAWDLRYSGATRVAGNKTAGESLRGPLVLPGTYQVNLQVGDEEFSQSFEVVNDPRASVSEADLASQLDLLLWIRDKISDTHQAINNLRSVRSQLKRWRARLTDYESLSALSDKLLKSLDAIEDTLILPGDQDDTFGLNETVRLNAALASVIPVIASADAKPTVQARELAEEYAVRIDEQLAVLDELMSVDLPALNDQIAEAGIPAIGLPDA